MKDLRKELEEISFQLDIIQKVYCTKEEEKEFNQLKKNKQPLPDGVMSDDSGYFRYVKTDMSKEEIEELFLYRQTKYLKTIKNSMLFFVVLTIISLVISLSVFFR